jgi:predicted nucleic acid-binding protein
VTDVLRLCLDLNIWCAALLADAKGRNGTASQCLVDIVRRGSCRLAPVQLIVSWGMLNRLRKVLEKDLHVSESVANLYIGTIGAYAQAGAVGASPQLTLGGTDVVAIHDTEDAHVLETAIAGRANLLVTANFKDFLSKDTVVVVPSRHAIYSTSTHAFHIVHPYLAVDWTRSTSIPPLLS